MKNYRGFLENVARDPAMRHRLWLRALSWAAYFGEWGAGHDFIAWLTEALFTSGVFRFAARRTEETG